MIAKNIGRERLHRRPASKLETDARLEFGKEALGSPAFLHEEVFHAGAVATLAQSLLVAEDFSDGANDGNGLIAAEGMR